MSDEDVTPPAENSSDDAALLAEVYEQLRHIARRRLSRESPDHTLQATELVHEAFLKLKDSPLLRAGRAPFLFAAAQAMRRILIDHARSRNRQKRGGRWNQLAVDVTQFAAAVDSEQMLALDEAISRLEAQAPETAAVVKLRFFTGLSIEETAEVTGMSSRTVKREWQFARAWLYRELEG